VILITKKQKDYELLDSGDGEKLERFGSTILRRPDPQALWHKLLSKGEWLKASANFNKQWIGRKTVPTSWNISVDEKVFKLKLSAFKHVGIFPEQYENWKWIEAVVSSAKRPISVLNLFGYTGGSTIAVLKAGGEVCHVDGSKTSITWAKENALLSNVDKKPVRWILDDVLTFAKREIKRGKKYDAVIMDPPAFGHGPGGELWNIGKGLPELVNLLRELLEENPSFVLINGYAAGYSSIAYENMLLPIKQMFGGKVECGELAIEESNSLRQLPAGIFARWSSDW
jgi:23S rRNA (cytosine1962-C5)-methyltransferase